MSKKYTDARRTLALSLLLLLALGSAAFAAAPAPISTPYYSVITPAGWEVDRDEDEKTKVVFIKSSAMFDEIYISINATKMKKQISVDQAWEMIKPQFATKKATVIFDGEEPINGVTWQKVVYTEKLAGMDMKRMVLFTIKGDKSFIIQFGSPLKKWDASLGQATEAVKSIKFKSK
jgi:hypothetical protein